MRPAATGIAGNASAAQEPRWDASSIDLRRLWVALFALLIVGCELAAFDYAFGERLMFLRTIGTHWRYWGFIGVLPKNLALLGIGAAVVLAPSLLRLAAQRTQIPTLALVACAHLAAGALIASVAALLLAPPKDAAAWPPLLPWIVMPALLIWAGSAALLVAPRQVWAQALRSKRWELGFVLFAAVGYKIASHFLPDIERVIADLLFAPTTGVARTIVHWWGFDTSMDAATRTLSIGSFAVEMAPSCLGYAGIGLVFVFISAYLYAGRKHLRYPQVLVMVPAAMGLIWLLNGVRIAVLMAIGAMGQPEVAVQGFHSAAGWVLLMAVTVGCIAFVDRSALFSTRAKATSRPLSDEDIQLVPQLVLLAMGLFTLLFTATFDWLYPVRAAAAAAALAWYAHRLPLARLDLNPWPPLIGIVVFILWIVMIPAEPAKSQAFAAALFAAPAWLVGLWLIARVVGSVVIVPLAEELAFRGFLLSRLLLAFGDAPAWLRYTAAIAISSCAFGLLHGAWIAAALAGVAYAGALYVRGLITDAVVAHATTNLLIAVYVVAGEQWSYW
ncbi:exosortase E/protease, VPEID-CTERM system [Caenimonas koreensis]|uniref:exosortase E/protease, VPEID-CTERM system n=1 Tax=Caenimonas koreensis TaxID=367474 RepID=UPI0037845735